MTCDDENLNLEILAEEAAEIIHIKSKCIRFGIDDVYPERGMSNRKALGMEIGNLLAMLKILTDNGTISFDDLEEGYNEKLEKLEKWYRRTDR